jgi:hypothetical protein
MVRLEIVTGHQSRSYEGASAGLAIRAAIMSGVPHHLIVAGTLWLRRDADMAAWLRTVQAHDAAPVVA